MRFHFSIDVYVVLKNKNYDLLFLESIGYFMNVYASTGFCVFLFGKELKSLAYKSFS